MRIEVVTVAVDYVDFLAETLPYTLAVADDLVVVTSPSDEPTKDLCRRHGVRYVTTEAFYAGGMRFSLGAGNNVGLANCRRDDWVLVLDADIVLPAHTRAALEAASLDEKKLYGVDRVTALGRPTWDAVKGHRQYDRPRVDAPPLRLGTRIAIPELGGYAPCGFFQLFNPTGSGIHDYPIHPHGTSEGSDMMHAARWERRNRELLPEIIAVHLETSFDAGRPVVAANWAGRRTPVFA